MRFPLLPLMLTLITVISLTGIPIAGLACRSATACTVMRFDAGGQLLVARNHDWPFGDGLMVVNPRGFEKSGISPINPAQWVSRYGSVSLVQFGREIPFAGMNERGLTVDLLQLDEAVFPATSGSSTVNVVQWVQYQLDTAASVGEVLASLQQVQPAPMLPAVERVHYFVTDAQGDAAVIEYLGGQCVVQHGTELTKCALANSPWSVSSAALHQSPIRSGSDRRYAQAVQAISQLDASRSHDQQIEYAFASLRTVSQPELTQWSLVYDPGERRIWMQTTAAPQRRWIDLDELSLESGASPMIIDVNTSHRGDLRPHLQPYSSQANARLVDAAFDRLMPAGFPRVAIKQLVLNYPATLKVVATHE